MSGRSWSAILYRWRVRSGTLVVALLLVLARPSARSLAAGMVVALAGLALRAWAAGHLRKEKELTVSGPYRFTRNPLYLGNMVVGLGAAVAAGSYPSAAVLAAYFLLFYPVIIAREARRMAELFPERYVAYRALVPSFVPSFRGAGDRGAGFRWEVFRKNKEWRAWLGLAVLWALLAARMLVRLG